MLNPALLRELLRLPGPLDDGLAYILRFCSFASHAVGKENLLDADISATSVIRSKAVKQASVPHSVTVTITGLLG